MKGQQEVKPGVMVLGPVINCDFVVHFYVISFG